MAKKGKKKVVKRVSSKASIRKKELEGPKEIAERIKKIAMEMVKEIEHGKNPRFKTKLRGRGNVVFDEDLGIITLGDKSATRTFLNIAHARKFLQTTLVMSKTYEYLTHNKTASIREVYYELKHTIGNTKENTFEDQRESDACIVDLEHSIDWKRYGIRDLENVPLTIFVNFISVHVPYTGAGKQAIADEDEIMEELRLALMMCARKTARYISAKRAEIEKKMKRDMFYKYIPEVAEALSKITKKDKDKLIKKLEWLVLNKLKLEKPEEKKVKKLKPKQKGE